MRAWLAIALVLPVALTGCPALLSDWSIAADSGAIDASVDAAGPEAAESSSGSDSDGSSGSGGVSSPDGSSGSLSGGSSGSLGGSGGSSSSSGGSSSGATSGAGARATGGGTGSGGSAGALGCPTGLAGPELAEVPGPNGGSYCIDATEVTNAEYAVFLAASPETNGQPPYCSWNTTFLPASGWPATGEDDHPVVHVDWCDAYAYCAWAGKRLCGKIGGGPNGFNDQGSSELSQWMNACSAGGTKAYPYSSTYSGTACNGADFGAGATVPVASRPSCVGGYPGLFDLSGNVWEWEDSCDGTSGASDNCRLRGGSFGDSSANLACGYGTDAYAMRNHAPAIYGFRCCAG